MKKQLISIAIGTAMIAATAHNAYADDQQASDDSNKQYIGTAIGATAGAIVAGPVGFNAVEVEQTVAAEESQTLESAQPASSLTAEDEPAETIILAQAGGIESVINDDTVDHTAELKDILVEDMSLDIFFLSGSTTVESFYQSRLQAVAKLMQQLPDIDIHLEGYSDRRGDKDTNLALSNQRLDSVRKELVQAGIDESRIHLSAFGELQFISTPGDLEAYTFDRRVVIRFQNTSTTNNPLASMENNTTL
jgi:outer membrane protein OmpA-like peptidoglycan-associated protein